MDNITFETERFNDVGKAIEFLKNYSKDNYNNHNGLNILSNHEIINLIGYLQAFVSLTDRL
jgi:hypothetical protein